MWIDEKYADSAVGASRYEHLCREMRRGHEDLLPVEPPGVAVGGGGGGRQGRNHVLACLEQRGREDRRTIDDAGKNSLLLVCGAESRDGQRAEHQRGQQRQRRDGAALLLEDEARLHEAVPAPADG